MNTANLAKIAASGLVLGSIMAGAGPVGQMMAEASAKATDKKAMVAENLAKLARKALTSGQPAKAITAAEQAVAIKSDNADYRLLLAEAYLAGGRFASAETSFGDVLALNPAHNGAALKLALSKIALGKIEEGRAILDERRASFGISDYGLAIALSGDVSSAITMLEESVRSGTGDARTRQNLAFSYAMAGKWANARVLASQDLSPELVDARMTQWAMMSRPQTSWDQVAGVLGVKAVYDSGQPVALALGGRSSNVQQAAVAPVAASQPVEVAAVEAVAAPSAPESYVQIAGSAASAETASAVAAPLATQIVMGPRQEIVQTIRPEQREQDRHGMRTPVRVAAAKAAKLTQRGVPVMRAEAKPIKTAVVPANRVASNATGGRKGFITEVAGKRMPTSTASVAVAAVKSAKPTVLAKPPAQTVVATQSGRKLASGQFVVQLGAYADRKGAEAGWTKVAKLGNMANHKPVTGQANVAGKNVQRLAVAGFTTMAEALKACSQVKSSGGQCFVRSGSDAADTRWAALRAPASKPVQVASRDN